jgi:RNA polymerase sigma-70 factor (sigma-E family)
MRADDERDFVEYLSARMPALHRAAFLLCGDPHRADDVAQATATTLYRQWRRVRAADHPDAYVHRILVRKYLDEKRLHWARVRLMPAPPVEESTETATAVEDRDELRTALAGLPRAQRTALVLRFLCDLSVVDTAVAMRCSPSNVKGHTSRGLLALRRILAPNGEPIDNESRSGR